MAKYIFVLGGVISGLGKGIAAASIGRLLLSRGYRVSNIKIDAYVNVDAGTMNPVEHGEVFVTHDGMETDQDIGNYERFLSKSLSKENYTTTGQIYLSVINRERNLEYGGKCVEVVPHIPLEVIKRIENVAKKDNAEIVIIEIGGTVGEYQNVLFLEAGRMMKFQNPNGVLFVLVSYFPIPQKLGEMKTKPTQNAVRTLNSTGIQADFILARGEKPLDKPRKEKISFLCNMRPEDIISAPDVESIYQVPIIFHGEHLDEKILQKFKLRPRKDNLRKWQDFIGKIKNISKKVKIAMVGKYFGTGSFTLADSYVSVIEAVKHGAWENDVAAEMTWVDAENFEKNPEKLNSLKEFDGVVVPGGFGSRGTDGIISAIQFARENKIPYLGLCYGMQLATVEFARNVVGLKDANSTEINPKTKNPVIHIMSEQEKLLEGKNYGGTMRLGAYPCKIKKKSLAYGIYKKQYVSERHRHRYEFNNDFREDLAEKGLILSGTSPNNKLVEIIELNSTFHPFFIGVQFHPEFQSHPLSPHPIFVKFIQRSIANK